VHCWPTSLETHSHYVYSVPSKPEYSVQLDRQRSRGRSCFFLAREGVEFIHLYPAPIFSPLPIN
jgi:hypothetical protein